MQVQINFTVDTNFAQSNAIIADIKRQYGTSVKAAVSFNGKEPVVNGNFIPGKHYLCIAINEKAKPGSDGQPRFTVGTQYLCAKNDTAHAETDNIPPTFLLDNGYALVNCGHDAKMKSMFILVD